MYTTGTRRSDGTSERMARREFEIGAVLDVGCQRMGQVGAVMAADDMD